MLGYVIKYLSMLECSINISFDFGIIDMIFREYSEINSEKIVIMRNKVSQMRLTTNAVQL